MSAAQRHRVTVIPGDGVGPEVTRSAVRIIEAAGVAVDWEEADAGAEVFKRGDSSGVPRETRESIERTKVVLKGPLETPVGFGEKSANVTLRKLFETYANVRPARELPGVPTRYSGEGVDLVIVRENIEDLYAGVEYLQTPDVAAGLKIISRKGSEKIIRYAFELARREGRTKVSCATKANIMKLTEGMFKRIFEQMAPEYPGITAEHIIIDNAAHQLVKEPAQFDIIVTTNLNGDIISDLASGLVGGLGFAA
ncbi:MAG: isocitrate/isopropylmalate family dehydrogenase, partial [Candidatus Limnocylindrales bacterium]